MSRSRRVARSGSDAAAEQEVSEARAKPAAATPLTPELQRALGNQRVGALLARVRADLALHATPATRQLQRVKAPVSDAQVRASVADPFTKMLNKYSLICGGTKIVLNFAGLGEVGYITGGMQNNVASVTNVKVGAEFQKQGLGKLLAAAFYAYWENQGAVSFSLGTQDTSGGFWGHLGMSSASLPVATAWAKLGAMNVERALTRGEIEFTDYSKRVVY
jgi:ribosomal protein S18 acetylase RimI-like enzyme